MKQASRQASRQASKPRGCAFKDEASLEAGFKAGLEAGLEAGFQGLKDIFSMKQALRPYQMQATKTNPCRQKSRESVAPNERQKGIQQPKTLVSGDKPASSWPPKQDPKKLVETGKP